VAGDSLGEWDGLIKQAAFEELLHSLVDVPEPGLEFEDGFADDREAEVPGLDEAGVYWSDRNLVYTWSLDREEREGFGGVGERGRGPGVSPQRVPPARPVRVPHEAAGQRVVFGHDAEQVVQLAFETAGRERQ